MMSETTSSPSVHLHPVSPSSESSLSSADSAPRSEPTSDEQPDLGAFTAVLREWTHLQPFPRIPVQVRSATSSTTPTFQPDQSVVGSEYNVGRSRRRNSRTSQRSGLSTLSSFTRPASSSAQPEGSTVWNQAPIASYLNSATPSNDMITEEDGESGLREGDYTPSPPASRPSTALTVEIASEVDFPSFDGSRDSSRNQLDSSPYSYHMDPDISLPVPLKTYGQRLDSRETAHRDEELEDASLHLNGSHGQNTSLTSRDFVRQEGPYSETSSLQSHSRYQSQAELTSIQLQSQAHPPSTIATSSSESLSFPVQNPTSSTFLPSNLSLHVPQRHNLHSNNGSGSGNSSTSTSTMITALLNRSRNPLQRATSDSSTVTTDSVLSSDFSLISYQIPETPSIINDEEVDPDQNITQGLTVAQSQLTRPPAVPNQFPSSSTSLPSTSAASGSLSLKTQKSIDSSTSSSHTDFPAFAEQAQPTLLQPFRVSGASHLSSFSSNGSPLPNPYSPIPPQRRVMSGETSSAPLSLDDNVGGPTVVREFDIVNDLGTPGEQVSELELFQVLDRATRTDLLPVDDIEEEEFSEVRHDQLKQARAGLQATRRHAPAYEGEGPSSSRGRPAQKQLVSKQIPHVELQLDDDADGDNDEDYPYRYPYSHTPGSYSQTNTPKGLPVHADSSMQSTSTQTLQRAFERSSLSFSQQDVHLHNSHNLYLKVQQEQEAHKLSQLPMSSHTQSGQSLTYSTSLTNGPTQIPSHAQSMQFPTQHHFYSYPFTPAHPSVDQPYSSLQNTSAAQNEQGTHDNHGYPHSLLGLHSLPASFLSPPPNDLPSLSSFSTRMAEPLVESDSISEVAAPGEDISDQPSLGYLDEALSFIASERARWGAARQSAAGAVSDSQAVEGGGSDDDDGGTLEGEAELPLVMDNEQDHPKRKRRRKRPPRSHGLPLGATASAITKLPTAVLNAEALADDNASTQFTPGSSPKKKRRSKSASASTSSRSLLLDNPNKSKAKVRVQEKEFLVPLPGLPVTILRRPVEGRLSDIDDLKTPTNGTDIIGGIAVGSVDGSSINLVGKKGRRVGRREREREKKQRDTEKEQGNKKDEDPTVEDFDIGIEYDDDDNDDGVEPQDDEDDDQGENDSLSNMALLQPPRRKRDRSRRRRGRDAHIHTLVGVGETGTYKSTPSTPMKSDFDEAGLTGEKAEGTLPEIKAEVENNPEDVFVSKPNEGPTGEKKKRTRTKRTKTLAHARSDPQLRLESDIVLGEDSSDVALAQSRKGKNRAHVENTTDSSDKHPLSKTFSASSGLAFLTNRSADIAVPHTFPPESKRGRLLTLAKKLSRLFPEQREELGRVITRIEKQGAAPTKTSKKALSADIATDYGMIKSSPVAIPGVKRRRSKKGHYRTGSEGTAGESLDFDDPVEEVTIAITREERVRFSGIEEEDDDEEVDPRGLPPRKNDALIHVFIDHSNILIGLLSHLKRHAPQRKIAARGRPLPAVVTKATTSINGIDKSDPAAAFAAVKPTSTRPLPVPVPGEASSCKQGVEPPIPLPSFATISRSLPAASFLGASMSGKDKKLSSGDPTNQHEKEVNSDSHGYASVDHDDDDAGGPVSLFVGSLKANKEKRPPKHLWHSALTLILERGRAVTRRVVVTSSPLYQPMESIERLGYELRVFIRVPDLGNGMDRERHRDKDRGGSGKSNGGGKSNQSSPATTSSLSTLAASTKRARSIGHVRQLSGNTSTESGSGGAGSGNASGGGGHSHAAMTNGTSQMKIKYREQGVDELLQLKLHQALAATDDVPEGSTIVLATGDGNMGQFNEEGFLGPVRTALRRGWKVELYAWEDGLSRAWRREFGTGSEWGRNGMFQIIGMEQFSSVLVEASGWS